MNLPSIFPQLLPEAVLLVTAFVVIALSMSPLARRAGVSPLRLVALLGVLGAVAVSQGKGAMEVDSGGLCTHDPLAMTGRLWILLLSIPAILMSPRRESTAHAGEFLALMLFAIIGMCLAVAATHLLMLFVALELAGLSFYLLAGWTRTRPSASAAIRYFLLGGTSAAFFLFGISLVYSGAPELTLVATAVLTAGPTPLPVALGLLMMLIGIGFKLAAVPMHAWAPDVYQKCPSGLVALVAAASKLTAAIVLARLCLTGFPGLSGAAGWGHWLPGWTLWLAVLAVLSMVGGNLLALGQSSVRRLLACSAIANAGYALVGFAAGGPDAAAMAIFHLTVYGLATAGALAITVEVEAHAGNDHRDSFRGLARRAPWQAAGMVVFFGSLASLPPMAGFLGKFGLFARALSDGGAGLAWLVGLGAVMSAVSLYYYLRVLRLVFEPGGATEPVEPKCPDAMIWPLIATIGLGLVPSLLLTPLTRALGIFFGQP